MNANAKAPKLAIAMNYIDDDLISGAIDYIPTPHKLKAVWFRHAIVAACFCLMVLGAVRITIEFLPETSTSKPVYGVLAEVIEIQDNGRYEVRITGEDQNFAKDDIVSINYDYVSNDAGRKDLKIGDTIAITYSVYEKTGVVYEIIPGQIDIVQSSSD